jgi:hypothetical protein
VELTNFPPLIAQLLSQPEYTPGDHERTRRYWRAKLNGKLSHLPDDTIIAVSDEGMFVCDNMQSLYDAKDARVPEVAGCVEVITLNREIPVSGDYMLVTTDRHSGQHSGA